LKELPEDLDLTYQRIFEGVPKEQEKYIHAAMQWLAFSMEPMTLKELAEAVTIDPDFKNVSASEQRFFNPQHLLDICPAL
jgi:hypothetical protein